MKRTVTLVLTMAFMALSLCCCGAKRDPKYIGKWEATSMTVNGNAMDNFVGVPIGALFRFEIFENGKVTWQSPVDNKILQNANSDKEITWKEKEENILQFKVKDLTGNNADEMMTLYYRDEMLVIEGEGSSIDIKKVEEFTEIDPDALNSAASVIQNFGVTQ
ncbi:MAG: hypothetical protein J6U00_14460 [Ruminococcus sp.]|jgi:hypothetical protein|uniref:hypothetical protein n=1 Tax=Ruminococcus sp. TaxID=41978 RepID=UPI001B03FC7A|nr:hypothetical protein [Ruminococcus sp.]MBO7475175.1 hypothetical protein [Ruminococcus sp.]